MTTPSTQQPVNLIADIGGTNIRLALADINHSDKFTDLQTFRCADYDSLADVISQYIASKNLQDSQINACLAIACPVDDDLISMTNLPWQFSQQALKKQLGLKQLTLINDYTAIAMAIPLLKAEQKVQIGSGEASDNKPISVCGPGTGLGVANLISVDNKWHCISGEGGHVDFAPVDAIEIEVLAYLKTKKSRVSYEQLLSGYGLEQIYQALMFIQHGKECDKLTAQEISANAINKYCAVCQQSLTIFCQVLGSFAGNLALTLNSQGGVYIAGGIVPRFIDYLKASQFRARFESKGRLSHIPKQAPTYVITEQQPGLLGAAAYILQS